MFLEKNEPQQLVGSKSEGEFAVVCEKVIQMREIWQDVYKQFSPPNSPSADKTGINNIQFEQAVDKLLTDLSTPTLTLATTGTTSSGKSTLVNLLCGADIMPRMAGEMSAGIVTIKHSTDAERLLKIQPTENAHWECGEWQNLSDGDIRKRLTDTMDAFNRAKKEQDLPSPVIELTYPIACFLPKSGMLNLSDLPSHTQFQIMDLPGIRNQDDQINSAIIQNCRHALSIVTYNMGETDEKKRQSLMEEVLEQVKLMGGSPARMLFALNRIDVFRTDLQWEDREQEATETIIEEIKKIIHERLAEHSPSLEQLSWGKLSSLPALLAQQMKSANNDIKTEVAEQINDQFGFFIPKELKEDLPRSARKWNDLEYGKVHHAVLEGSYANHFFSILEKHIRDNFAKLIIAPALVEFEGKVSSILDNASNTCTVRIESSIKNYQIAKQNLDEDYKQIITTFNKSHAELMQPLENFSNKGDFSIVDLRNVIKSTIKNNKNFYQKLPEDMLSPLYTASEEINKWLSGTVDGAMQSLNQGKINFSGTQADLLSSKHQNRLSVMCKNLMGKGYTTEMAKRGKEIISLESEAEELKNLKEALNVFFKNLSVLLREVHIEKSERENHRIRESLEKTAFIFIENVNKIIKENTLVLTTKILPYFILKEISLKIPEVPPLTVSIKEDTYSERNPWYLWVAERSVTHTNIPHTHTLKEQYINYLTNTESKTIESLINAIRVYFTKIDVKINHYIEKATNDVSKKYKVADDENQKSHTANVDHWKRCKAKTNKLANILQALKAV
jgi:hypothetical protein